MARGTPQTPIPDIVAAVRVFAEHGFRKARECALIVSNRHASKICAG